MAVDYEDIKKIKQADEAIALLANDEQKLRDALRERDAFEADEHMRDYAKDLHEVMCATIAVKKFRRSVLAKIAKEECPPPTSGTTITKTVQQ